MKSPAGLQPPRPGRRRDGTELVRIGEPLRPEFAAWREAEEIAAIADDLLVPRSILDRIAQWRGR